MHCGELIIEKRVTKGCPQGSVLGPILWNPNYDVVLDALDNVDCEAVAYADDLLILCSGSSRLHLERKLQRITEVVEMVMGGLNLKLSVKKTEAILLKGNLDANRSPIVKLYGKKIKFVKSCKYLGIQLDSGFTFIPHVRQLKSKLVGVSGKLMRVVSNSWGLNSKTLKLLYKGVFVAILSYGAACWYHRINKAAIVKTITSAQRPFMLMITNACRTVSTPALQVLAGVLPADLQIVYRGLQYENAKGNRLKWRTLDISWTAEEKRLKGVKQLRRQETVMN